MKIKKLPSPPIMQSLFLALTLLLIFTPFTGHAAPPFNLGIFPRKPPQVTKQAFAPLAKYLQEQLGRHVYLQIFKDYTTFEQSLARGEFDLVHLNHLQYLACRKAIPYQAVVMNKEFNSSQLRGGNLCPGRQYFPVCSGSKGPQNHLRWWPPSLYRLYCHL